MKLIIIQGAPATGKTTLAKKMAKDLSCTYFSKDGFKEIKFDELKRVPTLKQWLDFEIEARKKLYDEVASHTQGPIFIVESNLNVKDKLSIQKRLNDDDTVYEIYCYVEGVTSIKRYIKRNKQGEWHAGHRAKSIGYPIVFWLNFLSLIRLSPHKPLELSEHIMKVNTTDFKKVDYKEILTFVKG